MKNTERLHCYDQIRLLSVDLKSLGDERVRQNKLAVIKLW